jgi:hypothetical protein
MELQPMHPTFIQAQHQAALMSQFLQWNSAVQQQAMQSSQSQIAQHLPMPQHTNITTATTVPPPQELHCVPPTDHLIPKDVMQYRAVAPPLQTQFNPNAGSAENAISPPITTSTEALYANHSNFSTPPGSPDSVTEPHISIPGSMFPLSQTNSPIWHTSESGPHPFQSELTIAEYPPTETKSITNHIRQFTEPEFFTAEGPRYPTSPINHSDEICVASRPPLIRSCSASSLSVSSCTSSVAELECGLTPDNEESSEEHTWPETSNAISQNQGTTSETKSNNHNHVNRWAASDSHRAESLHIARQKNGAVHTTNISGRKKEKATDNPSDTLRTKCLKAAIFHRRSLSGNKSPKSTQRQPAIETPTSTAASAFERRSSIVTQWLAHTTADERKAASTTCGKQSIKARGSVGQNAKEKSIAKEDLSSEAKPNKTTKTLKFGNAARTTSSVMRINNPPVD